MDRFSVYVLVYGDEYEVAGRCLRSMVSVNSEVDALKAVVADFRIAVHAPSVRLRQVVDYWSAMAHEKTGLPVKLYLPVNNVFKYPTMRRMLYDEVHPAGELVMWFDDDSYLEGKDDFWPRVHRVALTNDVVGQRWWVRPRGGQWDWIQTQPWCNPKLRKPYTFTFCQGAWWCSKHAVLKRLNWPVPELRHNGGDSMFGEVCRHQGLKRRFFEYGVRINADEFGQHSAGERRGYRESEIAAHYSGEPLPTDHQRFEVEWVRWENGERQAGSAEREGVSFERQEQRAEG